jgi:hypothetical protein
MREEIGIYLELCIILRHYDFSGFSEVLSACC